MNEEQNLVDYNWLTKMTGDPFVDTGGYVIKYLMAENIAPNIQELISFATNIYVNHWDAKLNAFFLNSKITQPSYKSQQKISETKKYFAGLINGTEPHKEGYCRITGRKTAVFNAGRDNSMMSGSGTFVNFHHHFDKGIQLSKEVLIRLFFAPLGCIMLVGRVAIIQSPDEEVSAFFVHQNLRKNLDNVKTGLREGVLKSDFKNPGSALFGFANEVITTIDSYMASEKKSTALTLYLFTNFGASPEIDIIRLRSLVFAFNRVCQNLTYVHDWRAFIHAHFSTGYKGLTYHQETDTFEPSDEDMETIQPEEFRKWNNTIYNKLLQDRSIIPDILKWVRDGHSFNFEITAIYAQNFRNMKKEAVAKILELADFIVTDRSEDEIKKSITALNKADNAFTLRKFLCKLVAKNYQEEREKPLLTVKDYTEYLFSDSSNALEIRDLLVIGIYEKMHQLGYNVEVELETEEE